MRTSALCLALAALVVASALPALSSPEASPSGRTLRARPALAERPAVATPAPQLRDRAALAAAPRDPSVAAGRGAPLRRGAS